MVRIREFRIQRSEVEALILILGEMIFAVLAPLVAMVVDLIAAILAAIFPFVPSRRKNRRISGGAAKKVLIVSRSGRTLDGRGGVGEQATGALWC